MTTQQLLFPDCYLLFILYIEQIRAQIPWHNHGIPSPHAGFPSPNLWEDGSCSLYPDVWLWSYFNSDLLWALSPDSSSSSKGYVWCGRLQLLFPCTFPVTYCLYSIPRSTISLSWNVSNTTPPRHLCLCCFICLQHPFPKSQLAIGHRFLPNLMIFSRPFNLSKPDLCQLDGPWDHGP